MKHRHVQKKWKSSDKENKEDNIECTNVRQINSQHVSTNNANNFDQKNVPEHLEKLHQQAKRDLTNETDKEIVRSILCKYADTFSKDKNDLGTTHLAQLHYMTNVMILTLQSSTFLFYVVTYHFRLHMVCMSPS